MHNDRECFAYKVQSAAPSTSLPVRNDAVPLGPGETFYASDQSRPHTDTSMPARSMRLSFHSWHDRAVTRLHFAMPTVPSYREFCRREYRLYGYRRIRASLLISSIQKHIL